MKLSLILLVLFTGIFYVAGSVSSATFDIMKWSEACRAFTASTWVVCCILSVLIQAIMKDRINSLYSHIINISIGFLSFRPLLFRRGFLLSLS